MATLVPFEVSLRGGRRVTIRSAVLGDAVPLLEFAKEVTGKGTWNLTQADELTVGLEAEEAWIQIHTLSPSSIMAIAESEGELAGVIHFESGNRRRNAHAGEFGIVIAEGFRDLGLGTILIDTMLKWAVKAPGVEKVSLWVHSDNEGAIRLYRRMGFVEEGRKVRGVKIAAGHYLDSILMSKFVK